MLPTATLHRVGVSPDSSQSAQGQLRAKRAPVHISGAWIAITWIVTIMVSGTGRSRPSQPSLHEDAHCYRVKGAGLMATLLAAALHLLRMAWLRSIRACRQALMHDITVLLAMARPRPEAAPGSSVESALTMMATAGPTVVASFLKVSCAARSQNDEQL